MLMARFTYIFRYIELAGPVFGGSGPLLVEKGRRLRKTIAFAYDFKVSILCGSPGVDYLPFLNFRNRMCPVYPRFLVGFHIAPQPSAAAPASGGATFGRPLRQKPCSPLMNFKIFRSGAGFRTDLRFLRPWRPMSPLDRFHAFL